MRAPHRLARQQISAHPEVLRHGERGKGIFKLRHIADAVAHPLVRAQTGHRLAMQPHLARMRHQIAHDHLEQSALSGTVGTDDGHHFALAQREADTVQDFRPVIAGEHVVDVDQRHGQFGPRVHCGGAASSAGLARRAR
jgi:hypothetical protein